MSYAPPSRRVHSAYAAAARNDSPLGIIVRLYDKLAEHLVSAKRAMEEEDHEQRFLATERACQVILGLQSCLDFEQGGDVAPMLDSFYNSLFHQVNRLNFDGDQESCEKLIEAVQNVRVSWKVLADGAVDSKPTETTPTAPDTPPGVPPKPSGSSFSV